MVKMDQLSYSDSKTIKQHIMLPQLPPKPETLSPLPAEKQGISADHCEIITNIPPDLPFPTLHPEYATDFFKNKYGGALPSVPMPDYIEWLPNPKIKEFLNNQRLLDGYIREIYRPEFKEIEEHINQIGVQQKEAAAKILEKYIEPETGILAVLRENESKICEYHDKLKEFDQAQIEMYESLQELSKSGILEIYQKRIHDNERECQNILKKIDKDEKLTDSQLQELLSEYGHIREKWHLNNLYVSSIRSGKIKGL